MAGICRNQKNRGLIFVILFVSACASSKVITKQDVAKETENQDAVFKINLCTNNELNSYKVGEDIKIFFVANKDCSLKLISMKNGDEGGTLFPNDYDKINLTKAGFVYQIPAPDSKFVLKAQEPVGDVVIKAVATTEAKDQVEHQMTIKVIK